MHRAIWKRGGVLAGAATLALAMLPTSASAGIAPADYQVLSATGATEGQEFGTSVAVDDGVFVIGAPMARDEKGWVKIYGDVGYTPFAELDMIQAPDPRIGDRFGFAVDIDGDTVVVGAPYDDHTNSDEGGVYVYERGPGDTWVHVATLRDPNHWTGGKLGYSVAIDGNTIVAGEPGARNGRGAISAFRRDIVTGAWEWAQLLYDPDNSVGDDLGWDVDVFGATIIGGAPRDDYDGYSANGAVHVFLADASGGWSFLRSIHDWTAVDDDNFGWSVALAPTPDAGMTIAAGTPLAGPARGHVVIWRNATGLWQPWQIIGAPGAETGDRVGWSVDLDGEALVVGALSENDVAPDYGAAHTFLWRGATWSHRERLPSFTGPGYGTSVGVSGHEIIVGAPDYDFAGRPFAGRADVFLPRALCDGLPASQRGGTGNDIINGTPDDDILWGGPGADIITGTAGNDLICAGSGDDVVSGGAGDDVVRGGQGTDWIVYASATSGVTVDLGRETSTGEGDDVVRFFENVLGSPHADFLRGNRVANNLSGSGGDDTLVGLGGADSLNGGSGIDEIWYRAARSAVFVDLRDGTASGGHGTDTITAIENVEGSDHGDRLRGDDLANTLDGRGGNDLLVGRAGDDTLYGRGGDDEGNGGLGTDTCFVEAPVNCE